MISKRNSWIPKPKIILSVSRPQETIFFDSILGTQSQSHIVLILKWCQFGSYFILRDKDVVLKWEKIYINKTNFILKKICHFLPKQKFYLLDLPEKQLIFKKICNNIFTHRSTFTNQQLHFMQRSSSQKWKILLLKFYCLVAPLYYRVGVP